MPFYNITTKLILSKFLFKRPNILYSMALSSLDKNTLNNLLAMIDLEDTNKNKLVESIKTDYLTYAKLDFIYKQINALKHEANNILEHHNFNKEISEINCGFKKTPGKYYYLYKKKEKYLSLIPPEKWWGDPGVFICKLFYDFDESFHIV